MTRSASMLNVLKKLRRQYPDGGVLEIGSPFAMVIGVLLSARTRDEQVLMSLGKLLGKYPSPEKLATATLGAIEKRIANIGLYRSKARHAKALAEKLVHDFDGEVPQTIEELITLPGVGRKTASVVLVGAFHKQAIAVDTHVFRVVNRLGWVKTKTPEETEKQLRQLVPEKAWRDVNHTMVPFGRAICIPGAPRCWACPLVHDCAYQKKILDRPKHANVLLQEAKDRAEKLQCLKKEVSAQIV